MSSAPQQNLQVKDPKPAGAVSSTLFNAADNQAGKAIHDLSRPVRVLLVEDTATDAEVFTLKLRRSGLGAFAITHVECWAEAVDRLHEGAFDVLLLDLSLPDSDGTDTFRKARIKAPGLPILALTGNEDEAVALEAMRLGIDDYVLKGAADGQQLARSIHYAIERRRAEEALSEQRELLHAVIEGSSDAVFAKDLSGRYLLANAAAARAAGKDPGGLLGITDEALFSAEEASALKQADRAVITLGKTITCEETFTTAKGRRTFRSTKGPLRSGDGTIRGVFGISHDVTEMKHSEKHLQGMAALLKLFAVRSSRKEYLASVVKLLREWCECKCAGVRLLDSDGLLPYAAHVGFSREFLHDELKFAVTSGDCTCVRIFAGRPETRDAGCTSSAGSFFCNHTSQCLDIIAATSDRSAQLACVKAGYESLAQAPLRYGKELLGTLHLADPQPGKLPPENVAFIEATAPLIAEAIHKFKIEESLLESESRFRSMFERHGSAMLLLDPETGAIVDVNPAAAAFYGYSQEQLRTMHLAELQESLPEAGTAQSNLTGGNVSTAMHRRANGELRMVEAHSSPIRVQQRRLLFSIIHDITERTFLQKTVLEISEKERQRVGQDLHDSLGGKLTGAALMSKALAQKLAALGLPQADLAQEIVACINDSIRHTRSIARGLYPVDLSGAGLSGALAELAAEIERISGVRCEFHADKSFRISDSFVALHLFRLGMEAVNNAVRHAQPRHIHISLRTTATEVALEIRDDGKGMPKPEDARRGLGLRTMSYRAEAIGGQLTIKPAPEGGTIVACRLPTARLEPAPEAAALT